MKFTVVENDGWIGVYVEDQVVAEGDVPDWLDVLDGVAKASGTDVVHLKFSTGDEREMPHSLHEVLMWQLEDDDR